MQLIENPTNLDLSAQVNRVLRRNIQFPQRTMTASGLVTVLDFMLFLDTTAVTVIATLPDAASNPGMIFEFRSLNANNAPRVRAAGADTIDGVVERSLLTEGLILRIISDGTSTWRILLYTQLDSVVGITLQGGAINDGASLNNTVNVRDLDNGTGSSAIYSIDVPRGLDTSVSIGLTYYPVVITVGGGDADASFRTDFRIMAPGDLTSKAITGAVTSNVGITATVDRVHVFGQGFGSSLIIPGRFLNFELTRIATDAFTGNLGLMREGSMFYMKRS